MKKYKPLFAVFLLVMSLVFIIFVAIMQHKFNNPEFDDLSTYVSADIHATEDETMKEESDSVAGAIGSVITENTDLSQIDETSDDENLHTKTMIVTAETLNVRSGPGVDYELIEILVEGQTVEVEDTGSDWVKIFSDELTGYVNRNYLSEE